MALKSIASQIINVPAFAQQIPDLIHSCCSHGCDETRKLIKQLMKGFVPKKQEENFAQGLPNEFL